MIRVSIMVEDYRRLEKIAEKRGISLKECLSFLCEQGLKTQQETSCPEKVLKPSKKEVL